MDQNQTADFIIIGGGVIGCSTAYNLANQGAKNVVVLERREICSGGTSKSCAITRSHYSIEANVHHAVESVKIFENFDEIVLISVLISPGAILPLGPTQSHGDDAPLAKEHHLQIQIPFPLLGSGFWNLDFFKFFANKNL